MPKRLNMTELAREWRDRHYSFYAASDEVARGLRDLSTLLWEQGRGDLGRFTQELADEIDRLPPL